MAISSGIISTFFSSQTVSFLKPSLSSSLLLPVSPPPSTVNLRTVRTVICATASSQQQQQRRPRGIMVPRRVSPEMADLVGASEIPRTQVLKLIWAYIKKHNLQDPNNKKVVICDEKLKKIFGGRDSVGFLEVAGLISPHFLK